MSILIFILILSFLVFIHELGHFLVARKNGIFVEEFGLGLPPRVWGKKIGETIYSFNLLPFGGFVKLLGEDMEEALDPKIAANPRSFSVKKPGQRAAVLAAGVTMNTLLAIVIFYIILISTGFKSFTLPMFNDHKFVFGRQETIGTVVTSVKEGSGAYNSGIEVGEAITKVDGVNIYSLEDLRNNLKGKIAQEVRIDLIDLKDPFVQNTRTVYSVPTADTDGTSILGVYITNASIIHYDSLFEKILVGPLHSFNVLHYSMSTFSYIIGISVEEKSIEPVSASVAGPVGIYNVVDGILDVGGKNLIFNLLDFVALMSLSLAFINIMPFPALDGGRLLFIGFESITGKVVNPKIEANIHRLGMALLLGLIVLVTVKDLLAF